MCRFESDHRHSLNTNEFSNRGHPSVDAPPGVMHDKIMTQSGVTSRKKGKPCMRIKYGSPVVPIYKARTYQSSNQRFTVSGLDLTR